MMPQTLCQLAGREPRPPRLDDATLVLIDYQNEYLDGPLRLWKAERAVERAATLLSAARAAGVRIVHVVHRGATGGLFDRGHRRGAVIRDVAPRDGEPVVEKIRPNGFSDTDLVGRIGPAGTPIIIAGFMTHNRVSSTARAALDLGYPVTLAGDACATRDLPSPAGAVPADVVQTTELAALADRHACVTDVVDLLTRR